MNTAQRLLIAAFPLLLCAPQQLRAQPGTLDPTFNTTGYVVQPVGSDVVQKIVVQADQKILSIGMSWDGTFTAHAHVFRYNPDGTPDLGFGTNGVFTHTQDNEALLYSGLITPAGKILLVGSTTDYQTYRMMLLQLNMDGTPDAGFGINGVALQSVSLVGPNAEDMAFDVALDDQDNILVCGSSYDTNYVRRPVVARFTPDGVLDSTFGTDGVASIPVMAVGASAFKSVKVQPDGKIIASGFFGQTELWYLLLLARFNADGTLDSTFSTDGIVKHNYGNVDDQAEDLELAADGSIIVAGKTVTATYNYSALLMKFTPAGEVDATFGNAGAVVEDLDDFDYAWSLVLQPDGGIVMAGSTGDGPPNGVDMAVWKYLPDGTPDSGFGTNGLAMPAIADHYAMIYAMEVQADGGILVGGQARTTNNDNYFLTARLQDGLLNGIGNVVALPTGVVYPNPAVAGTLLTLRTATPIPADALVQMYAADGRLVCTRTGNQLVACSEGTQLLLPTDLQPGVYRLSIGARTGLAVATVVVE